MIVLAGFEVRLLRPIRYARTDSAIRNVRTLTSLRRLGERWHACQVGRNCVTAVSWSNNTLVRAICFRSRPYFKRGATYVEQKLYPLKLGLTHW